MRVSRKGQAEAKHAACDLDDYVKSTPYRFVDGHIQHVWGGTRERVRQADLPL
jgi:hypothetical protein